MSKWLEETRKQFWDFKHSKSLNLYSLSTQMVRKWLQLKRVILLRQHVMLQIKYIYSRNTASSTADKCLLLFFSLLWLTMNYWNHSTLYSTLFIIEDYDHLFWFFFLISFLSFFFIACVFSCEIFWGNYFWFFFFFWVLLFLCLFCGWAIFIL